MLPILLPPRLQIRDRAQTTYSNFPLGEPVYVPFRPVRMAPQSPWTPRGERHRGYPGSYAPRHARSASIAEMGQLLLPPHHNQIYDANSLLRAVHYDPETIFKNVHNMVRERGELRRHVGELQDQFSGLQGQVKDLSENYASSKLDWAAEREKHEQLADLATAKQMVLWKMIERLRDELPTGSGANGTEALNEPMDIVDRGRGGGLTWKSLGCESPLSEATAVESETKSEVTVDDLEVKSEATVVESEAPTIERVGTPESCIVSLNSNDGNGSTSAISEVSATESRFGEGAKLDPSAVPFIPSPTKTFSEVVSGIRRSQPKQLPPRATPSKQKATFQNQRFSNTSPNKRSIYAAQDARYPNNPALSYARFGPPPSNSKMQPPPLFNPPTSPTKSFSQSPSQLKSNSESESRMLEICLGKLPEKFLRVCPNSLMEPGECGVQGCKLRQICDDYNPTIPQPPMSLIPISLENPHTLTSSTCMPTTDNNTFQETFSEANRELYESSAHCGNPNCDKVHELRTCIEDMDGFRCTFSKAGNKKQKQSHRQTRVHKDQVLKEEWAGREVHAELRTLHWAGKWLG